MNNMVIHSLTRKGQISVYRDLDLVDLFINSRQ